MELTMDLDRMNLLFTVGTFVLAFILLFAGPLHIHNLNRIHRRIEALEHCCVSKEALFREMTIPQGSNFCALALASWILLFVAIAYLYLLVPTVLPYSYMQIPAMASSPFGFGIFGILVSLVIASIILLLDKMPEKHRGFKLTELYSFYTISKSMKRMIGLIVIALCISVWLSAYVGTIYPDHALLFEFMSLLLLIGSTGVLVAPIYREALGWRR